MKVVIFCQLALLLTTLTLTISALPTSLNFMTNPDNSQDELDLSSAISPPDEDLENSDVFISPEEIDNTHNRIARSVRRDRDYRWPNGIIFYDFDPSIENSSHRIIKYAMGIIEQETCLKFKPRTVGDRIHFTNGSSCSSDFGRQGSGKQAITLTKGCLKNVGIIMHEILHALGLCHEQNRPDRDNYIRVIKENIRMGSERFFLKKTPFEVDYYGERYDYSSIMHHSLSAGSKSPGLRTMEVSNDAEYIWQGQPKIGQIKALSMSDITQINRMYNCPGSGVPGTLQILIKDAMNLILATNRSSTDSLTVYVEVAAIDDQKLSVTKATQNVSFYDNTTWNELLDFGGRISWQYITIRVWSVSMEGNSQITKDQTFSLSSGFHRNLRHCSDSNCDTFLYFDYNLKLDRDECNPNPCKNNGTCHDLISNFMCYCPDGYSGPQCQHAKGRLYILMRNATDLPKRSNGDFVSPFVMVFAYTRNNSRVVQFTHVAGQIQSPQWDYHMDFGVGDWYMFSVRVYDTNGFRATPLSEWTSYFINSHTSLSEMFVEMEVDNGYVLFDYRLERE